MASEKLPFWLVNVPKDQWPAECPEFLVNSNEKDQRILSTLDGDYHIMTWPEVKELISIDVFPFRDFTKSNII